MPVPAREAALFAHTIEFPLLGCDPFFKVSVHTLNRYILGAVSTSSHLLPRHGTRVQTWPVTKNVVNVFLPPHNVHHDCAFPECGFPDVKGRLLNSQMSSAEYFLFIYIQKGTCWVCWYPPSTGTLRTVQHLWLRTNSQGEFSWILISYSIQIYLHTSQLGGQSPHSTSTRGS